MLKISNEDADWEPKQKVAKFAGCGRARRTRNCNLKSQQTRNMVIQSDSIPAELSSGDHLEEASKNAETESTRSVTYPLLPGATALSDCQFLSAQSIFDLLSKQEVRDRAVRAIPTGPKFNCFFVLNIGAELTDYQTLYDDNRKRIGDKLRDGTGVWNYRKFHNRYCYSVSDNGFLKFVKDQNAPFDLRMHRAIFRDSTHVDGDQPAERMICWFFNAERSPAPGFVVAMYLGSPYVHRTHNCSPKSFATLASTRSARNQSVNMRYDTFFDEEFK